MEMVPIVCSSDGTLANYNLPYEDEFLSQLAL